MSRTKKGYYEHLIDFNKIHPQKYTYPYFDTPYGVNTVIEIVCPSHGVFKQRINNHKQGAGCPECALDDRGRLSFSLFLHKVKEIYGTQYQITEHKGKFNTKTTVEIYHRLCGNTFEISAGRFLSKPLKGCRMCGYAEKVEIFNI